MMTRSLSVLCLVMSLSLIGCTRSPDFTERTLPSGRTVKLMGMGPMVLKEGTALMLRYRTDLAIDNIPSLQQEADDIWSVFRIDAGRLG